MKKILAVIGAVLVVIIAALLIIPSLIDWNGYKPQITQAVREATGRNLDIRGDLSMSVLPFPALSVEQVTLSNLPGAQDPDMVSVEEVRVSVALMPLLTGNVQVTEISLIDPVISIETFEDGSNNLVFDPAQATPSGPDAGTITTPPSATPSPSPAPEGDAATPEAQPGGSDAGSSDFASTIQIDRLEIENATILYHTPGSTERIEGLTLGVSADSLNGPAEGEGYVFYRGIPLTFNFNVGQVSQTGPFPVGMQIGIDKVDGGINVSGQVDLSVEYPGFNGQIDGKFDDLREAALRIAGEGADIPDIAAKPFNLGGQVAANAKSVTVNDLSIRFGETRGSGAIAIDQDPKMKADVALRFNQLDLDSILVLTHMGDGAAPAGGTETGTDGNGDAAPANGGNATGGQSIPSQGGKKSGAANGPMIPADLTASIDFEVETLIYNQTPVHNARINAAIANSKVTLNEVSAGLPGGTDFSVFGSISGEGPKPSAALSYEVASENIRAVARWLGADVDGIRADRLRRFSLTGGIKGTPDKLDISDLDMRIDDTAIRGAIVANLSGEGLPALGIGLKLDRINLDQYISTAPVAGANGDAASGATASDPAASGSGTASGGSDSAAPSSGPAAGGDAMVKTIKDALAPLDGIAANYRLAADEIISSGVSIKGISIDGSLTGSQIKLNNFAVADAVGLSASASGVFRGDIAVPAFEGLKLKVTAKTLEPVAKLTGITLPAPASEYKSIQANVGLNGPVTGPNLDLDVSNPLMQVALNGVLQDLFGATPGIDGKLAMQASSLNRVLPLVAPTYEPSGNLGRLVLDSTVKGNAKNVALDIAKFGIGPFETKGDVDFDASGEQPKLSVALSGGTLNVDPFMPAAKRAGLMPEGGSGPRRAAFNMPTGMKVTTVDARDGTPWDDAVIDVSALRSIDADISLALDQLDFDTYSLVKPDLEATLVTGLLTIEKFTGLLGGGDLSIDGTFDARNSDTPKLALKGSLDSADIEKLAPIRVANDTVIGGAATKFDVTASGNTSRKLVSALNGTANLVLNNVRFSNADKRSEDPKLNIQALLQQGPQAMVVEGVGNNDLVQSLEADIAITNGIAKTTRVEAVSRVGTADADATLDLPKWQMDTQADFDFSKKIEELPPFSVYAKGNISNPAITGRMDKVAIKVLDNILDKALGGSGSSDSGSSGSGSSGKDAAKDVLKGLLNQFGR
ncbi:AsmA family protein [Thalassospira xiamenensis]|uniref:AsmA domain-containing protein n=1 Tax=Thalassospira xiamenensis TaxID=220697 RepID=A0A367XGQ3_9PROT|nr:AsmA family protein [Thalassospira xiamenensis]KZB57497.1 hypothetical protein AUP41_11920 [Thalassospira xiamenensis]RCK52853.1 hypothetical protein TH44_01095 [Thalassospira xiamenensis]